MEKIALKRKSRLSRVCRRFFAVGRRDGRRMVRDRIDSAFTFVETLSVIVVMSLLSAEVGVAAYKSIGRAREMSARSQVAALKTALQSYYVDCGAFPTDEQGLSALWEKPALHPVPEKWNGPYTDKKIPRDPWGGAYAYFTRGSALMPPGTPDGLPYAIVCAGSDGEVGGDDDIVSWDD